MIELTRLNGNPIVINGELIKYVEENPDTVVTLVTGDKMVVREGSQEVKRRVLNYRRYLLHMEAAMAEDEPRTEARRERVEASVQE